MLSVRGNVDAQRGGEVRKRARAVLDAMSFPTGYSWSFGEAFEEEDRTQQEMLINLVLALVLVFLVMAGLFESLVHPFATKRWGLPWKTRPCLSTERT